MPAIYQRIFTIEDVAQIHILFQGLIKKERELEVINRSRGALVGKSGRLALIEKAYADWQVELRSLATITAIETTRAIQDRLKKTQKRPPTGTSPHLADVILCRPIETLGFITGQVGVADEKILDTAKNPYGPQYGPYWRTQEYGSPKMRGRILYGAFYGAGGAGPGYVPSGSRGGSADPLFRTVAQGATPPTGRMVIEHPPEARHFIRDGADIAVAQWRKGVADIETFTLERLAAALV